MANPASPRETNDTTGTKLWYGLWSSAGTATAAFLRVVNAAVVGAETTVSGALAVAAQTLHDGADPSAEGPVKIGGYAKDAAPSDVSADADRVNAWFLRNGAQATVVTAAGALVGGDATNGLDVDVTRVTGTVTTSEVPATSGGTAAYSALSTAAVLTAQIKGSAGQVYGLQCFNYGAAEVFIRLYNQTGAPGSGDAANIVWRGLIPGNADGAGAVIPLPPGLACGTGIGVRVTGLVADNDTTVLAANEVLVNVQYK